MRSRPGDGGAAGAPRNSSGARPRRAAALPAAAGVAVLTVAGVLWWRAQPAPDVGAGTVGALAAASAPSAVSGPAAPPAPASAGSSAAPDAIRVSDGSLPTAAATPVAPVRVVLPALGVDAPVIPVGVDADDQVAVPEDVATVGWYRFGPGVDTGSGSAVLVGHVDGARQGPGAFFRLRAARVGDRVEVRGADGRVVRYRVVAREQYDKQAIDLRRYFSWTGAPRLTLVTCGGSFDAATGHYRDNVLVTAVPVS